MAKTFLVTGAAGFIGSHTVETLLERGHNVIGLDNYDPYYDIRIKQKTAAMLKEKYDVPVETLDILDHSGVRKLLKQHKFDAIVHLAALAGVRNAVLNPERYVQVDLNGTQVLLDAMRECSVPHMVMASTSSVYGATTLVPFTEKDPCDKPLQPYAAAKRGAEILAYSYAHLYGVTYTAARLFTVYGPRNRPDMMAFQLCESLKTGKEVQLYSAGKGIFRDWTFVKDIAQGFALSAEKPVGYEVINLGRGEPVELALFVESLEKNAGRKLNFTVGERPAADMQQTHADISKAKALIGYAPAVSVPEGTKRLWEWFCETQG